MHHLDPTGYNISSSITAVLPLAQMVYTGDEDGKVVSTAFIYFFFPFSFREEQTS